MTTALDLFSSFVRLHPDGRVRTEPQVFDPDRDGWQVATYHVECDADVHGDHWEIHDDADEIVACLAGRIRLFLRPVDPQEAEDGVALGPGGAIIVPRGRWHRIEVGVPSDIMSVTVARGSRLQRRE